jgi:hypothetical protein
MSKHSTGQLGSTDRLVGYDIMDTHTYDDSGMGNANAHWDGARSMFAEGSVVLSMSTDAMTDNQITMARSCPDRRISPRSRRILSRS